MELGAAGRRLSKRGGRLRRARAVARRSLSGPSAPSQKFAEVREPRVLDAATTFELGPSELRVWKPLRARYTVSASAGGTLPRIEEMGLVRVRSTGA